MEQREKKYAALVLRNIKTSVGSVNYVCVTDALLSGGVELNEIALVSYTDGEAVISALKRLSASYGGVFLICDKVLVSVARDAVSRAAGKTAANYIIETEQCLFAVLPAGETGADIVRSSLVPAVEARRGEKFNRVVLRTVSAPADAVFSAIAKAQEAADGSVNIHTTEGYGCVRIEVVYNQTTPKMVTDEIVRILASELKDYIYAMEDVTVAMRLAEVLNLHRYRISTAESFTGGGVGRALVGIAGASKFFYEAINAYDNKAKKERLGVSEYTLKNHGAVSNETAYEMAAGLLKEGNCDIAVSTTGIAGPSSDDTNKPVGLCYIAVGTPDRVRVFEYRLSGSREEITNTAVNLALFLVFREINSVEFPHKPFIAEKH